MPWKEMCRMDQKRQFVLEWRSGSMSRSGLCELYGIRRQTGYKWAKRFEGSRSWKALEERSRRPLQSPQSTTRKLVKLILSQKKQFPNWGPIPILKRLQTHWPQHPWPAPSTIGAILKRHGMVRARYRRHRLPPRTRPFLHCREPNDVWCIDFKGQFRTLDAQMCYPLTVMDATTRYLFLCKGFRSPTLTNVKSALEELFKEYGLPKAIRSDNGEPFAAASAAGGLSRLSAWWCKLGIRLERIDPGKPQQNGRHERMHLTLKIETCSPPKRNLGVQQRAFDRFCRMYNEVRPHQALALRTPASLYEPSPRRMPIHLPRLHYPFSDCHRVASNGSIRLGRRRLNISSSLAGEIIGINQIDARYSQVAFGDIVLGFLDSQNLERGLIVPKGNRRRHSASRVSAMSPV